MPPTNPSASPARKAAARISAQGSEDDLNRASKNFVSARKRAGLIPGGPTQGGAGGGVPGAGGFGGPGGFGGGGPIAIGRLGRGFNVNQPHGFLYFSDDDASFDAKPYSLTGIQSSKASYNFARFGANVGGPLNIPHIFNGGNKWFFFAGWNGSRGSTPYDAYSTVPTAAERAGNFSGATYNDGSPVQIFNPADGHAVQLQRSAQRHQSRADQPASESVARIHPAARISARRSQNFHYVTNDDSNTDAISLRLIHNFGDATQRPASAGGGGGGGGAAAGGRARKITSTSASIIRATTSALVNPFPSLAGNTNTQGLQATTPAGPTATAAAPIILRFTYNHNHVSTSNLYSNVTDVAGLAGITGVSTDPFDFGIPGISFTTFGGLTDPTPRRELDQTYTVSDTLSWYRGKHNWRFGGDYRRILQSFRSAKNAEGSFVFTGLETSAIRARQRAPSQRHRLRLRRLSDRSAAADHAAIGHRLIRFRFELLRPFRARRLAHSARSSRSISVSATNTTARTPKRTIASLTSTSRQISPVRSGRARSRGQYGTFRRR